MSFLRWGRSILLLLVPFALFLVIAEIGLRLYLTRNTFYDVEMSRYAAQLKLESPNPLIGHVHRPNAEADLMNVHVAINSAGFRDDEVPLERTGRGRIVFLGDSLTFGWGVEQDETFAAILEKELSQDTPTEIINFGTGNYNTTQEVNLFLEKGLAYRPDKVVVFYFINDAEPVPKKSRFAWLGHLRIATFYWSRAQALLARMFPSAGFAEYYGALYRDDQPGWIATRKAFLDLKTACERNGIALQVVLLPELHELVHYPFAEQHAQVVRFLRDNGIAALDLAPRFADEKNPQSLWVSRDDAHPNARAHRLIASFSRDFLAEPGAR
jgi:lysophospholipase L1-like esterase